MKSIYHQLGKYFFPHRKREVRRRKLNQLVILLIICLYATCAIVLAITKKARSPQPKPQSIEVPASPAQQP